MSPVHTLAPIAPLLLVALSACDNRQAFELPRPGLERMLTQPRRDPFSASSAFPDGRSMQAPPFDTVPRERTGAAAGDVSFTSGREVGEDRDGGTYLARVPLPVTRTLLESGRHHFEVVCATCHGIAGDGLSVVAEKMERRRPESLHTERVRALPPGRVFEIATGGYGFMPGYESMLSPTERWAVVAYLDALRLSRAVEVARLPPDVRAELRRAAP